MNSIPNQNKQRSLQQTYSTLRRISRCHSLLTLNRYKNEDNNLKITNSNVPTLHTTNTVNLNSSNADNHIETILKIYLVQTQIT